MDNKNNRILKTNLMMMLKKILSNISKITNRKKRLKELKCNWEKKMSLNSKTKFNMLPSKFLDKSSKIIKVLKILKPANGISCKIYQTNMIEYTRSSTTPALIRACSLNKRRKDSLTLTSIYQWHWKISLRTKFSLTLHNILLF